VFEHMKGFSNSSATVTLHYYGLVADVFEFWIGSVIEMHSNISIWNGLSYASHYIPSDFSCCLSNMEVFFFFPYGHHSLFL
jgi:hypothetical protein